MTRNGTVGRIPPLPQPGVGQREHSIEEERSRVDVNRLFGGNPMGVIVRLVVISIIVGIVMAALGIRPENILYHIQLLIRRISELGFGVFEAALTYFLLGAAVVVPIWLIARLLGALGGRRERRE
jgi:hypothetical protein